MPVLLKKSIFLLPLAFSLNISGRCIHRVVYFNNRCRLSLSHCEDGQEDRQATDMGYRWAGELIHMTRYGMCHFFPWMTQFNYQ